VETKNALQPLPFASSWLLHKAWPPRKVQQKSCREGAGKVLSMMRCFDADRALRTQFYDFFALPEIAKSKRDSERHKALLQTNRILTSCGTNVGSYMSSCTPYLQGHDHLQCTSHS